ncbi:UDP-N-acetylmuramoyl-L-alanine--D-glutamate ligase [Helicobacter sp. MIT 14-3879]|uniref:UDP-N-acetylmuramoyl-L-alanine--D-glutamate ligase n=1 Tax=Helicobacter sp. MIT 14-3879 TaxID=2040649 RepID=UPI000E1F06E0|nr:UDP-N-acetylmuramoyl-L-alanine--D-glutamate ligase [Helicobacter sp. MIT 14-3879]RDU60933.1 UDP-N-acetylmuramoyl-L-alanine--D-glutamate ligase [Helicobacter sp. MIT 14-3879]
MISLFGYGKTLQELSKKIAPCNIYDDKFKVISIDAFGNTLFPSSYFNAEKSELEIISPGIPPYSHLAIKARNLISEYDYFASMPPSVWISGTNGKTTTTQMIYLLLKHLGVECGGNIGTPLCNLNLNATFWILETSSFMLHYTNKAKPFIYALLPITQDHISWHSTYKNYIDSKLKPLTLMNKNSIAIIPKEYASSHQAKSFRGKIYFYEDTFNLANSFNIKLELLKFKGAFLLDCVLSLCVAKIITDNINYDLINSFKIDSHKIEEFIDNKGRLFVDDSKATNISATLEAIKIYKNKKIFLILGGDNKGVSLESLVKELKIYDIKVYAIGKCSEHIESLCDKYKINCKPCFELKNALSEINKEFIDGVCMLSPACASLDQFNSYKQRGDLFKLYAMAL